MHNCSNLRQIQLLHLVGVVGTSMVLGHWLGLIEHDV